MKRNIHFLILIAIFFIAFFLRFYKLGEIPYGFYQDESAIGYNAYAIRETGKDEHRNAFPLYFKSFGDYKLPIYIYTTVASLSLFGLTEFAVRLPSALFGFLTIIVFYLFVYKISKNVLLAIIATFLLAINPWHLHYSRATFEVSIGLFFLVCGILALHSAFFERKKGYFLLGVISFIVTLYTYNLTRLLAPLLFIFMFLFFSKEKAAVAKKEYMLSGFIASVLLSPFFLSLLQGGGIQSASGTLITSSSVIHAQLLELRSYLIDLPVFMSKGFFNMPMLTLWQYIINVFSYLSVPFFFIAGSSHGNHGIGNVGQFYVVESIFIVLGIYTIIRNKIRFGYVLFYWILAVILVASLTREAPHATRSFFMVLPLNILSAYGLLIMYKWIRSERKTAFKRILFASIGFIFVYNIFYYFISYYNRFPLFYAKAWRSEDKALSNYIAQNQNKYEKIIFDEKAGFIYTSFLFFTQYSPSDFQNTVVYAPDDSEGFSKVASFGKFSFRPLDWEKEAIVPQTLYITTQQNTPRKAPIIKEIYYPQRPVVISVKQEILQYPIAESAYVLIALP